MINFKAFKLHEIFEKIRTKRIKGKASNFPEKKSEEYIIPLLTAGAENHGFARYARRQDCPTILKDVISISANGANTGISFYQDQEFAVLQDAYAIKLKDKNRMGMGVGIYLTACLNKLLHGNFDWSNKAGWNNIKELEIILPINKLQKIDFQYMEDRVKALEQDRVKAFANYLTVTGLDDYELTEDDREVLTYKPKFSEFKIEDIFKIHKGKRLTKANQIEGNTLFVGSTALNHGETARIGQNPIFKANTITVCYNGSVGETFYQDEPYWASDDINVLTLKDFKLNAEIAEYLCAVLKKAGKKYGYTYKWNVSRMKKSIISLPVTTNKVVDFKYMENYIKAVQKLTIKNVVKYKDEVINKTKEVINIKKF